MKRTPLKRKPIKKKRVRKTTSDAVLDTLVRTYVRRISGGYCKRCKRYVGVENIETAHMFGRNRKTVRWDLRNVYPLCSGNPISGEVGCHYIVDNDPIEKTAFLYEVLSKEEIESLQKLANQTIKESPIDREEIKVKLQVKLTELK